jgi:hypothetical protein
MTRAGPAPSILFSWVVFHTEIERDATSSFIASFYGTTTLSSSSHNNAVVFF